MLTNTHLLRGALSHDRNRLLAYTVLGAGALSLGLLAGWQGLQRRSAPAPLAMAPAPEPAANPYAPMVVGLGPWARGAIAQAPDTARAPDNAKSAAAAENAKPIASVETAPAAIAEAEFDKGPAAPLPPRRPAELKNLASRVAPAPIRQALLPAQPAPAPAPAAPVDNRGFFEKIFGSAGTEQQVAQAPQPAPAGRGRARQQAAQRAAPATQALAYAAPESTGGLFSGVTSPAAPSAPAQSVAVGPAPRAGGGTAVYEIASHTVHMPDGSKLEAHSGLREFLDDPRYVHVRMRGPTPPSVYALTPREALFHGVEALRLTPVDGNSIFGRAGLLAHTYMLGPNGDSNGCVSFRDYNAFLQAYKRGEVRRLVVVARM
jgi:hypothetical protein